MNDDAPPPDWRLIAPAVAAWASAWWATQWPATAWWLAGALALVLVGALALAADRRREVAATVALIAAGGILTAGVTAARAPARVPEPLTTAADHGAISISAVTTALPRAGSRGDFYRVTLSSHNDAPALLFAPPQLARQPIGTALQFSATVKLAEPGSDVVVLLFARGDVAVVAPPQPLLQLSNGIRQQFVEQARSLPPPGGMLVPGLAVGDETLVDAQLSEAMKTSSLTHLTAVSGSNIAIVVAGFLAVGRLLRWPRAVRCAVAATGLAGFVLLVTPQGSVIRAAAMALIVLALEAAARPATGAPVLALAVIVLLAADPWLSHNYGFALSATATAALLLGTRPLARFLERWLPPPIALLIAVPLSAQIACQPVLILLDPSIPLYGVVANLLAAPAAPLGTVFGLIACLVSAVLPPVGAAFAWFAWLPAQWIALVATTAQHLPAARLPWLPGGLGALAWLALCAALVLLARGGGERWARRLRGVTAVALVTILVAVIAWSVGRAVLRLRDRPAEWRLVACDVGQGDGLLLRAGGATVMIDTGEEPEPIAACLREFGVTHIDVLLLSHFDIDHCGAAASLPVPIGEVWLADTEETRREPLTHQFQAAGLPIRYVAEGDVLQLGDLTFTALWPRRSRDGAPGTNTGNDASLAVRTDPTPECTSSCFSTLFLGDLDEHAQTRLDQTRLDVDVVKMSHHGSADQSAELYLRASAQLALLSSGAGNEYGHPTPRAMEILTAAGTPWIRTDQHGSIAVYVDGGELAAWTTK